MINGLQKRTDAPYVDPACKKGGGTFCKAEKASNMGWTFLGIVIIKLGLELDDTFITGDLFYARGESFIL